MVNYAEKNQKKKQIFLVTPKTKRRAIYNITGANFTRNKDSPKINCNCKTLKK